MVFAYLNWLLQISLFELQVKCFAHRAVQTPYPYHVLGSWNLFACAKNATGRQRPTDGGKLSNTGESDASIPTLYHNSCLYRFSCYVCPLKTGKLFLIATPEHFCNINLCLLSNLNHWSQNCPLGLMMVVGYLRHLGFWYVGYVRLLH